MALLSSFIPFLFQLQTTLKLYHWNTTSYARHKATDELIEQALALGDRFVEVAMGKYGRPKSVVPSTPVQGLDDKSVVVYLDTACKYLSGELGKLLKKEDTDLVNIRDELLSAMNQTKYLFTLE